MFDHQAVEAYRSLTAPDSLREQILNRTAKQPIHLSSHIKAIGALAACIALIVVCSSLWLSPARDVSINVVPSSSMLSYAGAVSRSSESYAVINVEGRGFLTLTTNDAFYLESDDQLLAMPSLYKAKNQLVFYWPTGAQTASFAINGTSYTLTADHQSGNITLVQD